MPSNSYSQLPATSQSGLVAVSIGDGSGGLVWSTNLRTVYDNDTYSVSGTLVVPSGATGYLPPFFKVFPSTTTVTLIGVIYMVRAGTATITVNQNGSAITGLTGLTVTTTATTTNLSTPLTVTSGDYFAPVITAVSASDGMSLTFIFGKTL